MPAYNTGGSVAAAVRSVLAQTRSDLELVVVDDGSRDDTAAIVEALQAEDARVRLVRQENQGAAAARNNGIAQARGRFVSFIDSDDLWLPTYLEAMGAALEQAPAAGFAYTDAWTLDADGRVGTATAMQWQHPPAAPPETAEELMLELLLRNFVYAAVTVPKAVFEAVGPFDASLRAAIDYEMWLRMASRGYTAVRPPGLLAVYTRDRPGSISSNRAVVVGSLAGIYDRLADDPALEQEARDLARRRAQEVRAELSALQGARGLDAAWRAQVRPALIRARNTVLRRDGWRATPPPELVEAFPALESPTRGRTVNDRGL